MGKLIYTVVLGLIGAAIVHIAIVFTMPRVADNDAWGRLSRLGDMLKLVEIEPLRAAGSGPVAQAPGSRLHDFAFVDPAFITASCRFSVEDGPVRLFSSQTTPFWSASIYDREGSNVYSISDRSAVTGHFDLMVGTTDQLADLKGAEFNSQDTTIPVEVGFTEGFMTLRALVSRESERPAVQAFIHSVACEVTATEDGSDSDQP